VDARAAFCFNCGARQATPPETIEILNRMSDRTASMLGYIPIFGVIPAIIFLASHKYRKNSRVRFDAFQSVYLFVAFLIVSSVLPAVFLLSFGHFGIHALFIGLLKAALFITWIYLLITAAQEQQVHLPIVGDLAARSAAEQM
jgi:uncharacterized membrane protein